MGSEKQRVDKTKKKLIDKRTELRKKERKGRSDTTELAELNKTIKYKKSLKKPLRKVIICCHTT